MPSYLDLHRLTSNAWRKRMLQSIGAQADQQGARVYLVGGTVRDYLLRRPSQDWDLAIEGDVRLLAEQCAERMRARLVVLDTERLPTMRLVWRTSPQSLDLVKLRADTIEEDLVQRDLTINAMAVDMRELLDNGRAPVLDPCGGLLDLRRRLARFTSEDSAIADPLRLLRCYRFAATLRLAIDPTASALVERHAGRIQTVAMERVRDEWCKLLDAPNATPVLRQMDRVGLLVQILPEIQQMKGVEQNAYHHLGVWEHTLLALEIFEQQPIPEVLMEHADPIKAYLRTKVTHDKRKRMLIKLALLLHDVAKPATRSVTPEGRVHFIGHEKVGAEMAIQICNRLKLGGKAKAFVRLLVYNHLRMMYFAKLRTPSPRAIRRFIRHTGEDWLGVLLLSHADLFASQGEARQQEDTDVSLRVMGEIAHTYYHELEELTQQPRLITGDDVLRLSQSEPGRWVGLTLRRIEDMQFNGELTTREQALQAASDYLRQLGKAENA